MCIHETRLQYLPNDAIALTFISTLLTMAGCKICRRKDAWHFIALGKFMLIDMLVLAVVATREATCSSGVNTLPVAAMHVT